MQAAEINSRAADLLLPDLSAAFGHALHARGIPVSPERSARFAECINLAQPTTTHEVYWLGRVALVSSHAQLAAYDAAFDAFFRGQFSIADSLPQEEAEAGSSTSSAEEPEQPDAQEEPQDASRPPAGIGDVDTSSHAEDSEDISSMLAAASSDERLRERDFAACTDDELALIRQLVDRLPLAPPPRPGRRSKRHQRGSDIDIRATLRRSHRTGGEPIGLVRRRATTKPRRVVLLADVSGSMEPYARIYLHLMRGAVRALGAEAFAFATRLTRLTRILAEDSVDAAYAHVARATPDWSGGTLIGEALMRFLDDHGRRGVARGAVIVIVSDGWDTGDPAVVAEAMARLARMAHRIIWVNPRSAAVGFEPLVRGMAAAMPYVDTFVSGHSVAALQRVLEAIATATERRDAAHG